MVVVYKLYRVRSRSSILKPRITLIWDFTVLSQILRFIHADLFGLITSNLE